MKTVSVIALSLVLIAPARAYDEGSMQLCELQQRWGEGSKNVDCSALPVSPPSYTLMWYVHGQEDIVHQIPGYGDKQECQAAAAAMPYRTEHWCVPSPQQAAQ